MARLNEPYYSRVIDLIRTIERAGKVGRFDMEDYIHVPKGDARPADEIDPICGSVACIAGWAVLRAIETGDLPNAKLVSRTLPYRGTVWDITNKRIHFWAQDWLGLTKEGADQAFTLSNVDELPRVFWNEDHRLADVTAQDAVAMLRHYAETGVVDWRVIERAA